MTRDELMHTLDEAIAAEEDAFPLYKDNLIATLEWADLNQTEQQVVMEKLKRAYDESITHRDMLIKLKDIILGENKDVY